MKKVWANQEYRERRLENRRKVRAESRRKKKEIFLTVFSETGVIKRAIEASGSSYSGYHHWMADDLEFAVAFKELQSSTQDIALQHMEPHGVKPFIPRDEESQQWFKDAFLNAFEKTSLINAASGESGVPAHQHRTWLERDPVYAELFSQMYERKFGQKWEENWRCMPTSIEMTVAVELQKRGIPFEGPRVRIDGYNYALDILIPRLKLNVEADGTYWHDENHFPGRKAHDDRRDNFIRNLGYSVLRLPQVEIDAGDWHRLDAEITRLTR
jgi:very-short-patch-repair endonuclease